MVLLSSSDCPPVVSALSCDRKCVKERTDSDDGVGYEIKELSGRGSGLIATKDFCPGSLIMRESPIITMPDKVFRYTKMTRNCSFFRFIFEILLLRKSLILIHIFELQPR